MIELSEMNRKAISRFSMMTFSYRNLTLQDWIFYSAVICGPELWSGPDFSAFSVFQAKVVLRAKIVCLQLLIKHD